MVHVALRFGERPEVAYVLPLSVDGLLVVASAAMVDDKTGGRRPRTSAKVAFTAGVAASIAANITAANPSIGARAVAAWPAIALLLVVELMIRKGKTETPESSMECMQTSVTPPEIPRASTDTNPESAGTTSEPLETTGEANGELRLPVQRVSARNASSRAKVEQIARRMPSATAAQIAAKAGVSESTARRYLPRVDSTVASPTAVGAAEMPMG
jgi:hypothetical protein